MPFVAIEIPPGIVKSDSDYATTGRWLDCNHVRFVKGRPEKIGGTTKLAPAVGAFDGIARTAKAWASFIGVQCLVFGTACSLYLLRENTLSKITPFRTDATNIALATDPFAVVSGDNTVTVTDNNHGITQVGTIVKFSGATAGGGITIDGEYEVATIIDVNSYTIEHSAPASSTDSTTGGASVLASYELNCGSDSPEYVLGWGVGGWGIGGWGVDASLASAIITEPSNWSMDLYGEDLIVNPMNGGLYLYDTSTGNQRPAQIAGAPTQVRYVYVTEERYVMALGCITLAGTFDSMTVRWPDVLDPTDWTPSDTNRANERKLQGGTRLMGGRRLGGGLNIVWSDTNAFMFQFTGGSTSYASRSVGDNCGLVGPNAHTSDKGAAFWMSERGFFMYDGSVQNIPNQEDMRDYVFRSINKEHITKTFAFYNPTYNEVWFVYPSQGSTEPNLYVMVSIDNNYAWVNGTWDRSAHARYQSGETRPILFGLNGTIYIHDVDETHDDDGTILPAWIELAPSDIDGDNTSVDIFGFVPDCKRQAGTLMVHIYGKDHPRDDIMHEETLPCEPTDKLVDARVSGRQFGMTITSNVLGGDFRLGRWGLEVSVAGKKRGSIG
jgi:hypothetical protein